MLSDSEIRNQNVIDSLIKKHNISTHLDTLEFAYSYQYQEITKEGPILITSPEIIDLYKTDSAVRMKIGVGFFPKFILSLSIPDSSNVEFLYDYLSQDQISLYALQDSDVVLAVSLDNLMRPLLEINIITNGEYGDDFSEDYAYINLEEAREVFIGTGQVIDVRRIERRSNSIE